jgi:hypothetical protein
MANYWGTGRLGTHQSVAYTGTAGVITNAFGSGVQKVRVVATTACYVAFGAAPTATTSSAYLPADSPEYFTVSPGEKVSAVQLSSGGTLHVTEIP